MRLTILLAAILAGSASCAALADQYPISGAWAFVNPNGQSVESTCAAYAKDPKNPVLKTGQIMDFQGTRHTDFNMGYLEIETVDNVSVRKTGPNTFLITDRYYSDGEGGFKVGYLRRSYTVQLVAPDRFRTKGRTYGDTTFVKCGGDRTARAEPEPAAARAEIGGAGGLYCANKGDALLAVKRQSNGDLAFGMLASYAEGRAVFSLYGRARQTQPDRWLFEDGMQSKEPDDRCQVDIRQTGGVWSLATRAGSACDSSRGFRARHEEIPTFTRKDYVKAITTELASAEAFGRVDCRRAAARR